MTECSRAYEFESHCGALLLGLDTLRRKRLLFDVTLIASGVQFEVHRAVLAACSEYFRALFTGAMKEQWQREVTLNGVTAVGMHHLLDYAYTAKLTLHSGNVQDVLTAANHLSVLPVVRACTDYLRDQLELDNCVEVLTFADTLSLTRLSSAAYQFIGRHLQSLSRRPSFQRLTAQQWHHLLCRDIPVSCREAVVLRALLSWIVHEPSFYQRLIEGEELLACVRYENISRRDFSSVRRCNAFQKALQHAPDLCRSICDAFCRDRSRRSVPAGLGNPRGFSPAIVNVGGFTSNSGLTNRLSLLHTGATRWKSLTLIPHVEQCDFGLAVLNNVLYVAGGCFNDEALTEQIHPFVFSYDPRTRTWDNVAPLLQERCRFLMAAVPPYLVAIGGDGLSTAHNCERYDLRTRAWQHVSTLSVNVSQAAGVVVGRCVYVSGGLDASDTAVSTVSSYNVDADQWSASPDLLTSRADHGMAAVDSRLYVVGGWSDRDEGRVLMHSIDSLDLVTAQWTQLTNVPLPRYHASVVAGGKTLYVIGGLSEGGVWDRRGASRRVDVYDVSTGEWYRAPDCTTEIWEHASCVMYMPMCNDEEEVGSRNKLVVASK